MEFSKRMDNFSVGIFSKLLELKNEQINKGRKVIDLSVGTPNIPPASHIKEAIVKESMDEKNYIYAINDLDELKEAVSYWYKNRYKVKLDAKNEVVAVLGSQEGLSHISLALINEGDLVLVPDPCYPVFKDGPLIAGANLYFMPQKRENGYIIDLDEIPKNIRKKAKMMIVSYPNNPTTVLATDDFYKKLISFAKENEIIVIHDNAYSDLVFDNKICKSFLNYEGANQVGVEFNSLSKTYGMAGARIGFCVGNKEIISKLKILKSNMDYGIFIPIQKGAIAALTGDQACVNKTMKAYERRRDILCDGLNSIGWEMDRSPATMFVWARLPKGFTNSEEFAIKLLEEAGVLVTPGSAFGPSGEGHVRLALVQDEEDMLYAIEKIKQSKILE